MWVADMVRDSIGKPKSLIQLAQPRIYSQKILATDWMLEGV